jgi:hypothetical protein
VPGQFASESSAGPSFAESAKLITEDAFTVAEGRTEVELGYQLSAFAQSFDSSSDLVGRQTSIGHAFALQATRGVSSTVDVAAGGSWSELGRDDTEAPRDELGNAFAFAKWTFFVRDDQRVAFAWVPGLTAPFGVDNRDATISVGQDFYSLDNRLVFSYLTERVSINADSGYSLPVGGRRANQRGIFFADAAFGYQLEPWIQPIVEVSYSHGLVVGADGNSHLVVLGLGAVSNVSNAVRVDVGFLQGVFGRNTDSVTGFGVNFSVTF